MRDFKRVRGAASSLALLIVLMLLVGLALFATWWVLGTSEPHLVDTDGKAEAAAEEAAAPPPMERPAAKTVTADRGLVAARIRQTLSAPAGALMVQGMVRGPGGQAVADARVVLRRASFQNQVDGLQLVPVGQARTDAGGRFELSPDQSPAGRCSLRVQHPSAAALTVDHLRLPAAGSVDLGVLSLRPGYVAFGKVLRESDLTPIPGATIHIQPQTWQGLDPADVTTVRSDADGQFRAANVSGDLVRVDVTAAGYARGTLTMVSLVEDPHEDDGMVLRLYPPQALAGTVLSYRGQPMPGARVLVQRSGPVTTCAAELRTGQDGGFEFTDLHDGYYDLRVEHSEHAAFHEPRVHTGVTDFEVRMPPLGVARVHLPDVPDDDDVTALVLVLESPDDTLDHPVGPPREVVIEDGVLVVGGLEEGSYRLEVRVAGAAPTRTARFQVFPGRETDLRSLSLEAGATLRGRVINAAGTALRARVAVVAPYLARLARGRSAFGLEDRVEITCDAEGRFELPAIAMGTRTMAFALDGYLDAVQDVEVQDSKVDLGEVTLSAAGILRGEVQTPGGQPVPGRYVDLEGEGMRQTTRTDDEGRYEFQNLAPGNYRVGVAAPDGLDAERLADALTRKTGDAKSVTVEVDRPATLDFTVAADS